MVVNDSKWVTLDELEEKQHNEMNNAATPPLTQKEIDR